MTRYKKQCTYPGCGMVVCRLDKHMRRTHKMLDPSQWLQYTQNAVRIPVVEKDLHAYLIAAPATPVLQQALQENQPKPGLQVLLVPEQLNEPAPIIVLDGKNGEMSGNEKVKSIEETNGSPTALAEPAPQQMPRNAAEAEDDDEDELTGYGEWVDDDEEDTLVAGEGALERSLPSPRSGDKDAKDACAIDLFAKLDEFRTYLYDDDIGISDGNVRDRVQQTREVLSFLQRRSPCASRLVSSALCARSLFSMDMVSKFFRQKLRRGKTNAGTLKAKVSSFGRFLNFLLQHADIAGRQLAVESVCRGIKIRLLRITRALGKRIKIDGFRRQKRERAQLLQPSDIVAFTDSTYVRGVFDRMLAHQTPTPTTKTTNCDEREHGTQPMSKPSIRFSQEVRNVLISLLALSSIQRSGCLSSLTVGEFLEAEEYTHLGKCWKIIRVESHKTFSDRGYAVLAVDDRMYRAMNTYLRHMRAPLGIFSTDNSDENAEPTNSSSKFFVNTDGSPLQSGYISSCIKSVWKKSGVSKPFRSVTSLRKSVVTYVHEKHPGLRGFLATMMSHSLQVAEGFYKNTCLPAKEALLATVSLQTVLKQNIQSAANASEYAYDDNYLAALQQPCATCTRRKAPTTYQDAETQTSDDYSAPPPKRARLVGVHDKNPPKKAEDANVVDDEGGETKKPHGRRRFTPEEVALLLAQPKVQEMVENKKCVSTVLRRVLQEQHMKTLARKHGVPKIRDRVRSAFRSSLRKKKNQDAM